MCSFHLIFPRLLFTLRSLFSTSAILSLIFAFIFHAQNLRSFFFFSRSLILQYCHSGKSVPHHRTNFKTAFCISGMLNHASLALKSKYEFQNEAESAECFESLSLNWIRMVNGIQKGHTLTCI